MECSYKGHCGECEGEIKERHGNTAYHYSEEDRKIGKPDPNLIVSCEVHYQMHYDYYQELWDEYYRGRL